MSNMNAVALLVVCNQLKLFPHNPEGKDPEVKNNPNQNKNSPIQLISSRFKE